MTRREAEAAALVLRWAYGKHRRFQPERLQQALETLAAGAQERGAEVSVKLVRRWHAESLGR